jgi:hypothetical protein
MFWLGELELMRGSPSWIGRTPSRWEGQPVLNE